MKRIEIYLTTGMEVAHFAPIVRALMELEQDVSFVSPQTTPKSRTIGWDDADRTEILLRNLDLPWTKTPDFKADCVLTIQTEEFVSEYRHTKIRMQYGVGLIPPWNLDISMRPFDYHLVHGPFGQRVQFRYHALSSPMLPADRVKVIGYPKFDYWFWGSTYQTPMARPKPVLLWLPTWGRSSSIDRYADAIFALSDKYDIWVRPHHGTVHWERDRMTRLAQGPCRILDFDGPAEPAFAAASVVLADFSSGVFCEALFLKQNTIALCSELEYRNALIGVPGVAIARTPYAVGEIFRTEAYLHKPPPLFIQELFDSTEGADGMRAARTILECL